TGAQNRSSRFPFSKNDDATPGDRKIARSRSALCRAASNSNRRARCAVSLPVARFRRGPSALRNFSRYGCRRSSDRPRPKAAGPSSRENHPATKDKAAGRNRDERKRCWAKISRTVLRGERKFAPSKLVCCPPGQRGNALYSPLEHFSF